MEQIRLTCGSCNRRYRLPGNASGYFRCKNCDMVLAIPNSMEPSERPGETMQPNLQPLDEILLDPETQELVYAEALPVNQAAPRPVAAVASANQPSRKSVAGHKKKTQGLAPSQTAGIFVGGCLAIAGFFTMLMQLLGANTEKTINFPVLIIGLLVALLGIGGLGWAVRHLKTVCLPICVGGGIGSLVLFGVGLIPSDSPGVNDQIAKATTTTESLDEPDSPDNEDNETSRFSIEAQLDRARRRKEELDSGNREDRGKDEIENRRNRTQRRNARRRNRDRGNALANNNRTEQIEQPPETRTPSNRRSSSSQSRSSDRPSSNRRSSSDRAREENPGESFAANDPFGTDRYSLSRSTPAEDERPAVTVELDFSTSVASGSLANEIADLWDSVEPPKRIEKMAELKKVVRKGLRNADDEETGFWKMYDERLRGLKRFADGKWVPVSFRYGLTGWTANPDNVRVESENAVAVTAPTIDTQTALLTSADTFFGPVSIKARIGVQGPSVRNNSARFGFAFTEDSSANFPNQENCLVMFDASLQNVWAGTTQDRLLNPSTARKIAETSVKNVDLQVNVSEGYVQVFANGMLVVEKFDRQIQPFGVMHLVAVNPVEGECEFRCEDWQVRKWKSGRPPGKLALVEEDLMHLTDAIKEFDDLGWYHYRLALAQYGCRKFESAIESANKAVELGVDPKLLAMVFAIDNELKKKDAEAARLYTQVSAGRNQALARAWHAWFVATHPQAAIRNQNTSTTIDDSVCQEKWAIKRIRAALAAKQGNFAAAARMLEGSLREVPVKFRGDTSKQLQAYKNGTIYTRETSKPPFYHSFKTRIVPDQIQYDDP